MVSGFPSNVTSSTAFSTDFHHDNNDDNDGDDDGDGDDEDDGPHSPSITLIRSTKSIKLTHHQTLAITAN